MGAVSYLQIMAPELTDKMLAEFLDIDQKPDCQSSCTVRRPDEGD